MHPFDDQLFPAPAERALERVQNDLPGFAWIAA
ncbi:hypothetical protein EDD95_4690 [Streptomyces sp. CEV 2-1]|nr:hypothetical protein EDD95_4690 [Streptomyces sp. CEV 2-1]